MSHPSQPCPQQQHGSRVLVNKRLHQSCCERFVKSASCQVAGINLINMIDLRPYMHMLNAWLLVDAENMTQVSAVSLWRFGAVPVVLGASASRIPPPKKKVASSLFQIWACHFYWPLKMVESFWCPFKTTKKEPSKKATPT